jgi:hypothetical protein
MNRIAQFILLLFLFLSATAPAQKMDLPEDKSIEPIKLPFKVSELKINDLRQNKMPMDWNIVTISERKELTGNPELSQKNKDDIDRIVKNSQPKEDGVPANFEINILEGECKVKPGATAVREFTRIKAELTVMIPGRSAKVGASAEGNYDNAVFNGSKEHLIAIYDLVLRNVIAELLKEIKDSVKQ